MLAILAIVKTSQTVREAEHGSDSEPDSKVPS